MLNKKFLRIFIFFIWTHFAFVLGLSLTYLYLVQKGMSYNQILIADIIGFASALLMLFILRKISVKTGLIWGVFIFLARFFVLYNLNNSYYLYLDRILIGINLAVFYVSYNIIHYTLTHKRNIGLSSGLLFSTGPILGIIISFTKGFIVDAYGFNIMFLAAGIVSLPALFLLKGVEDIKFKISLAESMKKLKGLRTILFIEGLIEAVPFTIIPVVTLFFIKTPINLGIFSSYLAILSFSGNILFGRISDKFKNRKIFVYAFPTLLALSIIGLGFSENLYLWGIFSGLVGFFLSLSWPFMTALVVDVYPDAKQTMMPREFMLNLGRLIGALIFTSIFIFLKNYYLPIILIGLIGLIYPVLIKRKNVYN